MTRSRDYAREIVACMYDCMRIQDDKPFEIKVGSVLTVLCKDEVLEQRNKRKRHTDKSLIHILTEQRKKWQAIVRYVSANGKGGLLKDADFETGMSQMYSKEFFDWYTDNVLKKNFAPKPELPTEEVVN